MDWGELYDIWVHYWGLAPSEFWAASPAEWWRLYDLKRPRNPETDYAGNLTQSDVEQMMAEMKHG